MVGSRSLTPITEQEYEAIEAAVMETARGRWFLSEFSRRNRQADTGVLLDAIGRLESAVVGERQATGVDRIRFDLAEMARAIARTKAEIAAIQAPSRDGGHDGSQLTQASEALDAIVRTTERATSDILGAAEHVQEVAWTLREAGASHASCDELDRRATEIYTACSFQDLTAQRTTRIVNTLRYLEARIAAMMGIWEDGFAADAPGGSSSTARGAMPGSMPGSAPDMAPDLSQSDVDRVIAVEPEMAAPARRPPSPLPSLVLDDDVAFLDPLEPEEATAPPPARSLVSIAEAFGDIDALSVQERLLRFT
jgi:chemotaxis regulatin CheY-phosphate phosphatase CheZ